MPKDQFEAASIRQKEEMVKRVLVVAELLFKGSEATVINPKITDEASEETRDAKPIVSS